MITRVKICGITRAEDARAAANLGADAVGLVFYPGSPRAVTLEQARAVVDSVPPFVTTVALFMDPTEETVRSVLKQLRVDLLQFHGDESPAFCEDFGHRYIKAIAMGGGADAAEYASRYSSAAGYLLDSNEPGRRGGTGEAFDWSAAQVELGKPLVLAGGLTPDNVREAIRQVRPFAVDVSSGVERQKGVKDVDKMTAFMNEVRSAQDF